jgi:hypothetical protein
LEPFFLLVLTWLCSNSSVFIVFLYAGICFTMSTIYKNMISTFHI